MACPAWAWFDCIENIACCILPILIWFSPPPPSLITPGIDTLPVCPWLTLCDWWEMIVALADDTFSSNMRASSSPSIPRWSLAFFYKDNRIIPIFTNKKDNSMKLARETISQTRKTTPWNLQGRQFHKQERQFHEFQNRGIFLKSLGTTSRKNGHTHLHIIGTVWSKINLDGLIMFT